jgi:hypothetical protein
MSGEGFNFSLYHFLNYVLTASLFFFVQTSLWVLWPWRKHHLAHPWIQPSCSLCFSSRMRVRVPFLCFREETRRQRLPTWMAASIMYNRTHGLPVLWQENRLTTLWLRHLFLLQHLFVVKSEDLVTVAKNITVFWDVSPCNLVDYVPMFRRNLLLRDSGQKSTLKMEAEYYFVTLISACKTMWNHIPIFSCSWGTLSYKFLTRSCNCASRK